MQHSGFVDQLIFRGRGGAWEPLTLGRRLRAERPDLAVALSQSATMASGAWLSAAPERVGYIDSDLWRLLNRRVQERGIPCPEKVLHLVRCLGLEPEKTDYVGLVSLSPEDRQAGEEMLRESKAEGAGPLIALAPGESTDRPYKSWSAEGFAAVLPRPAEAVRRAPIGPERLPRCRLGLVRRLRAPRQMAAESRLHPRSAPRVRAPGRRHPSQ